MNIRPMPGKREGKKILVAGGAGFVGSHLCDALLARGNFVIALDNLSTGSVKNIAHLKNHPRFKFIKGDVIKLPLSLPKNVGQIYHLASPASPKQYQKHPIETFKANVIGSLNLLEVARKSDRKSTRLNSSHIP